MTTERLVTATLMALLALGGCAKSQEPLPNKNTNWLDRCQSDADCGDLLECRCGMCTVACEDDATCELEVPSGVCLPEQSEQLIGWCEPGSSSAICAPRGLGSGATGGSEVKRCEEPDYCEKLIAEGLLEVVALTVANDRIYWMERSHIEPDDGTHGALKSTRLDGGDLMIHADGLLPSSTLKVDGDHAYFSHDAMRTGRSYLSRIPLGGGGTQHIYEAVFGELHGIELIGTNAYFMGDNGFSRPAGEAKRAIFAAPIDGSLFVSPLYIPEQAEVVVDGLLGNPNGFITVRDAFYWTDGRAIRRFDMAVDREPVVIVPNHASEGIAQIAHHDGYLIWNRTGELASMGIGSVQLDKPSNVQRIDNPDLGWGGFAADGRHVYGVRYNQSETKIIRVDRETRATQTLRVVEDADVPLIALSDEHVFVAVHFYNEIRAGFISRFAK